MPRTKGSEVFWNGFTAGFDLACILWFIGIVVLGTLGVL